MILIASVSTIWIAKRPAMIDLPQHAAQVVAWRALLEGRYAWGEIVQLNYVTPYLLGYGLILPLTYLMSVTAAAKLLLSVSFIAFVYLCTLLRQELGGGRGLDWLFVFGFFGFAWRWGYLPFLCAAPLVILFLVVALRQARTNSIENQLLVLLTGILLLFSHGLQFLFAVTIGGLFVLASARSFRSKIMAYAPYCVLAALTVLLWWAMRAAGNPPAPRELFFRTPLHERPWEAFHLVLGCGEQDWTGVIPALVAFAAPLVFNRQARTFKSWIPFTVCVAILLTVPHGWMSTAALYQRFALFLLPLWALTFKADEAHSTRAWQAKARFAVLAAASVAAIAIQAERQLSFSRDSRDFETILAAAEPKRRALSLIYQRNGPESQFRITSIIRPGMRSKRADSSTTISDMR